MNFLVNLTKDKWKFLNHHRIYGTIVIPTSFYLKLAWDVLNSFQTNPESSVIYKNVIIHDQLMISFDEDIELVTMVQKGIGIFIITKLLLSNYKPILMITLFRFWFLPSDKK